MRTICHLALTVACAAAQTGSWTYTTIFSFQGLNGAPDPGTILALGPNGELYGVSAVGVGSFANGSVFELTPPSAPGGQWTMTTIYMFLGGSDGEQPYAGVVVGADGSLYGTTRLGGTATTFCGSTGCGTAYQLTPPTVPGGAWTHTVLYNFQGPPDAVNPQTPMAIGPDGSLYGSTYEGGANSPPVNGNGTVYQLTPPSTPGGSWTEAVIHSFRQFGPGGCNPTAGIAVDTNGVLYGSTTACSIGTIFSLSPPASPGGGWTMSLLRKFGTQGTLALGPDGKVYAAAFNPVLQLTPPASPGGHWTQVTLHKFACPDGCDLGAGPVLDASGAVYGTTTMGGTGHSGIVYQLVPPATPGGAWTENELYNIPKGDVAGSVILAPKRGLYGVSGINGGSVYELTPPSSDFRR